MSGSEVTANLGTTATILAYIVGQDQRPITVASVKTVTRRLVNKSVSPPQVIEAGSSLTPGNVIFDVPLIDNGWPANIVSGYNFRDRFVCSQEGDLEVIYTLVDQNDLPIVETQTIHVGNVP